MIVQRVSLEAVIERCNRAGVPVIAGGPHPTTFHDEIAGVDHFVLDEAEEVFPGFLRDLEKGAAGAIYRQPRRPDVTATPIARFDLIDLDKYYSMGIQFSRGCPFDCEFCDITKLYGRTPRTKTPTQMVAEFDTLYGLGWKGPIFLVDDNFIGNKRDALRLLPVIAEWQKARGYPFALSTEASLNLARMDGLLDAMIDAGFDTVFLGIETPTPKALVKTRKPQNTSKTDENFLFNAVRKIQRKGMQVQGGFILGLDSDDEGVFDAQIDFIQQAGIPAAPINLLTAAAGNSHVQSPAFGKPASGRGNRHQFDDAQFQARTGPGDPACRVQARDCHALRSYSRELLPTLPDPFRASRTRTASEETDGQERHRCHRHESAPSTGAKTGSRLHEIHRQGLSGPSPHASHCPAPGGSGLPLRKVHPTAERGP